MIRIFRWIPALFLVAAAFDAAAHHSRAAFYDMTRTVELEGEITRVQWRHPHVRYWIQADPAYGGEEWELETTPPSILERMGIGREILAAGTRVRVAGPPSKLSANAMEVSHVLLPDGVEVLLHRGRTPLWTDNIVERTSQGFDPEAVREAIAAANGIFRVWSRTGFGENEPLQGAVGVLSTERPPFWLDSYPLTDAAQEFAAAWDPVTGIDTACAGKDMPWLMSSSWPFQFVDDGDMIRLLAEEFDRVRVIHLQEPTGDVAPSPLGHSVGYWEGRDLIANTTHINSGSFNGRDIPMSADAETIERFSLSTDESRLDYEIMVIDPATFTEPVTMSSFWIWQPGEIVKPYNCIETPGSWSNEENKTLLEN